MSALKIENCREYDAAAMDLARRGLTGAIGDPLPNLMSGETVDAINADPEAFQERVKLSAYALAMNRGEVSRYIRTIRNAVKKAYAEQYLAWVLDGRKGHNGPEWDRSKLSYMGAQAVRMNIDEIFPEGAQ